MVIDSRWSPYGNWNAHASQISWHDHYKASATCIRLMNCWWDSMDCEGSYICSCDPDINYVRQEIEHPPLRIPAPEVASQVAGFIGEYLFCCHRSIAVQHENILTTSWYESNNSNSLHRRHNEVTFMLWHVASPKSCRNKCTRVCVYLGLCISPHTFILGHRRRCMCGRIANSTRNHENQLKLASRLMRRDTLAIEMSMTSHMIDHVNQLRSHNFSRLDLGL